MSFLRRSLRPLVLLALIACAALLLPSLAYADTLGWSRSYAGPTDFYNYPDDPIPVAGAFNAVAFADSGHGWAVGKWVLNAAPQTVGTTKALFAFSSDGGSTWTSGTVDGVAELNGVTALDATHVWAVGNAGAIARWNGISWSTATLGWTSTYSLRGIAFSDAAHGWAVGDGGGIARTTDGGITWTVVTAPTSTGRRLRAVTVAGPGTCIAVGDGGAMVRLTDAPQNISSGTSRDLYGVTFPDASHGYAVGDGPTVMRTSNGGTSWTTSGLLPLPAGVSEVDRASRAARAASFADSQTGVVVGQYQVVWRTVDGGDTWQVAPVSDPGTLGDLELRSVTFVPGSDTLLVTVGRRDARWALDSNSFKARAYAGTWAGRVPVPPAAPASVSISYPGAPGPRATVSWVDASSSESGFNIQRSKDLAGPWADMATVATNTTSWIDTSVDWGSTWYYRVRSYRGALASAWTTSAAFKVDSAAPVTTSDAALVYELTAHITLAVTDGDGSGVASTDWELVGESLGTGTTVDTSVLGWHTLRFRSTDVAGNAEAWQEVRFFVSDVTVPDAVAPVTRVSGAAYPFYVKPTTVSLVATDNGGAGVLTTFCRVNGGAATETSSVVLSSTGTYTLQFWSVDLAGNVEATQTAKFIVLARPSGRYPSTPVVPAAITHSRSFTTYGYLMYHTSGTYPVTLYFYRYKSGKYVYYKSVTAKASRISVPGTDFSKYARSTSVPYAGKWRVRARHVMSGHSYYSSFTYFTAK